MASSPAAVCGGGGPALTKAAAPVVAVACAVWSTAAAPAAVDRPEYSSTAAPMWARALAVTVTVGFVPPPAVIGAVHTLSSVLSEALKPLTLVYVLPAESVTPEALGLPAPHTPTCTTSRLPVVTLAVGASARLVATARLLTCCTNAGTPGVAAGAGRAMAARTAAARSSAGSAHVSLTRRGARAPFVVETSPAVWEITPSNVS